MSMMQLAARRELKKATHALVDTIGPKSFVKHGALYTQERTWRSPDRLAHVTAGHDFRKFAGQAMLHDFSLTFTFDHGAETYMDINYYTGGIIFMDRGFFDDELKSITTHPLLPKKPANRVTPADYEVAIEELRYGAAHL